jgi:uncharacterized protein
MSDESQIGVAESAGPGPAVPTRPKPVAPVWHTILFIVIPIGLSFFQYRSASETKLAQVPSLLPTYVFTVIYELVLLGYVYFLGLRRRNVTISEIVGGRWERWGQFWLDVGIALLFWLVVDVVLAILSLELGFSGIKAAQSLIPRTPLEMVVWVLLSCCAGFCEEIVFRGYLQRQFVAWTGNAVVAVALQAMVFGAAHLYQGTKAVFVISVYGALFGSLAVMRKSLRPGIMQHAGQDTLSGIAGHFVTKLPQFQHLQMLKF